MGNEKMGNKKMGNEEMEMKKWEMKNEGWEIRRKHNSQSKDSW